MVVAVVVSSVVAGFLLGSPWRKTSSAFSISSKLTPCVDLLVCLACLAFAFRCVSVSSSRSGGAYDLLNTELVADEGGAFVTMEENGVPAMVVGAAADTVVEVCDKGLTEEGVGGREEREEGRLRRSCSFCWLMFSCR